MTTVIDLLRRYTTEPTATTYTDDEFIARIAADLRRQVFLANGIDPNGLSPDPVFSADDAQTSYLAAATTVAASNGFMPHQSLQLPYTPDLHRIAADVWEEKVAALSNGTNYTFSADGQTFNRGERITQAKAMVSHHRSRQRIASAMIRVARTPRSTAI